MTSAQSNLKQGIIEKLHQIPEGRLKHSPSAKVFVVLFFAAMGTFLWQAATPGYNYVHSRLIKFVPSEQRLSYNWPVLSSQSVRTTYHALNNLSEKWGADERSHSLLIALGDSLLLEKYYNGYNTESANVLKSVCKLWISTLTGIAINKGLIADVNQPVAGLLPHIYQSIPENDLRRQVTIEHLLSMRSGYRVPDERIGSVFTTDNWVADVAMDDLAGKPGDRFFYSTPQTHLLAGALTASVNESLHIFAQRELCRPLNISIRRWDTDPQGIPFGGSELMLTSRDLLRLGTLYLKDGVIDGQRILPQGWVEQSFKNRRKNTNSNKPGFGYSWWLSATAAGPVKIALGNGGQALALYPDQHIMVAITCQHNSVVKSNGRVLNLLTKQLPSILAETLHVSKRGQLKFAKKKS